MPANIYRMRETQPQCRAVGDGFTRRELIPYLRNYGADHLANPTASVSSGVNPKVINFPLQRSGGIAEPSAAIDFPFDKIRAVAKNFKWIDSNTGLPARREWEYGVINKKELLAAVPKIRKDLEQFFKNPDEDSLIFRSNIVSSVMRIIRDNNLQEKLLSLLEGAHYATYTRRLSLFWYADSMKLETQDPSRIRVDLARNEERYAEIVEVETINRFKALEVKCGEDKLKDVIWQGYSHNFWPLFKYDPQTNMGQIDDSLDPIKGLYINPWGSFTIDYGNRSILDKESLRTAAIVAAICYDIPFLEDKFGGYQ